MKETIGSVLGILAISVIVIVFTALPTMWLWNWLMPYIFDLPPLDFWQALGLTLLWLCSFLFKLYGSSSSKK